MHALHALEPQVDQPVARLASLVRDRNPAGACARLQRRRPEEFPAVALQHLGPLGFGHR